MLASGQEYYTLVRRSVAHPSHYPQLSLDQNLISPIAEYSSGPPSPRLEDDFDSNDEDNPDYDYPDEDEEESRSSEGLIGRGEGYWGDSSEGEWDEGGHPDNEAEDEEEIYRRYLRREKRKESKM